MLTADDVVLVTTATGKIGTELTHRIASHGSGARVRAATRDPASDKARLLASFHPERVTPVRLDVDDPKSLAAAFDGVTQLAVIAPFSRDMAAWHEKLVAAAK